MPNGLPRLTILFAALAPLTASCADDPLSKLKPKIVVDPEKVDFGDGIIGRDNLSTIKVKDAGDGVLEISKTRIDPEGVFRVVKVPATVAPSATAPLDLAFVPIRPHEVYDAVLTISSNDPSRPELQVPLHGVGGVHKLEVFPRDVDFGDVDEGSSPHRTVEIRNVGGDPLLVSSVTWTSTAPDLHPVAGFFTGGAIGPGEKQTVDLVYAPAQVGTAHGILAITSNDEMEPVASIPVHGRANLAPIAVAWGCDVLGGQVGCAGVMKGRLFTLGIHQRIGLDGRDSTDPEGQPIAEYRWVVVERPMGSNAVVFHSSADRQDRKNATGDMEVDAVGRFDIRLIVKDARGLESFDKPESHVIVSPKDLELLLRWDVPTDLDLHVVRPGGHIGDYGNGAAGTSTGSDCSSFNRAPNWGDPITHQGDPRLDIDDVVGRGPEIISLNNPQPGLPYKVYAHYCDSHRVHVPANATIEVYMRGRLIQTVPMRGRTFALASGELWEAAQVVWEPTGPMVTVTDQSSLTPVFAPHLCQR